MKALLTGASSFTGLWFARALAERGVEVIAPLRKSRDAYFGVRAARVAALHKVADVVPLIEFGGPEFFAFFDRTGCDVVCHHAARVENYRSVDFDINAALLENTRGLKALSERLATRALAAVVLTGSAFEENEGTGSEPLRAFSPYAVSKGLTASVFRYWCEIFGLPLGKFVIANPFGPFEEPRFCAYLIKTWAAGGIGEVRTPLYIRDNIHVSLLAKAYAAFVLEIATSRRSAHFAPTFYAESQGDFANRFAREIGQRIKVPCQINLREQTDFAEPMIRINTDPVDAGALKWNESSAWDEIADYYAGELHLR